MFPCAAKQKNIFATFSPCSLFLVGSRFSLILYTTTTAVPVVYHSCLAIVFPCSCSFPFLFLPLYRCQLLLSSHSCFHQTPVLLNLPQQVFLFFPFPGDDNLHSTLSIYFSCSISLCVFVSFLTLMSHHKSQSLLMSLSTSNIRCFLPTWPIGDDGINSV